jgi:hypothetical protein
MMLLSPGMMLLAVRSVQVVLLAGPVLLAICATIGASRRRLRSAFGLSRRALVVFRVGLGVTALLDLCSRASEASVWLADDGMLSRKDKLQLCMERPEWANSGLFGGRACGWSLYMASGTPSGQSLLMALQALLAVLLVLGVRARACAFALMVLTDSLHNSWLSHGGVGARFHKLALFWAWQLPLTLDDCALSSRDENTARRAVVDARRIITSSTSKRGGGGGGRCEVTEFVCSPASAGFVLSVMMIFWDCVVSVGRPPTAPFTSASSTTKHGALLQPLPALTLRTRLITC